MSTNSSATEGIGPAPPRERSLCSRFRLKGGLAKMSKQKKTSVEIWDLDGNGTRFALVIDGVIQFVGSQGDCKRRASILDRPGNRDYHDQMLRRALQH